MAKQPFDNRDPNQFGNYQFIFGQTKNPKPYRARTSYSISTGTCTGHGFGYAAGVVNTVVPDLDEMFNSRYASFWKKVHDNANLALTLVDHKQSYAMVKKRSLQFAAGISALSRFNRDPIGSFARAADAFTKNASMARPKGASPRKPAPKQRRLNGRNSPPTVSDAWLELQFGWLPLMEDIAACSSVLTKTDFNAAPVRVSKTQVKDYEYYEQYYDPTDGHLTGKVEVVTQCGATVRQQATPLVTNGDIALAGSLGLLNLPFVLWDGVPFSFVADWFVPIGRFLANQSLDYGYTVTDSSYSQRVGGSARAVHWFENDTDWASRAHAFSYSRGTGFRLSAPSFAALDAAHQFKGDAWKAATAVALVNQQIHAHRHLF